MREIKFRAWSEQLKQMYMPDQFIQLDRMTTGYWDDSGCPKGDSRDILIQYTGLHDKNGKEIYEGDILSHHPLEIPTQCYTVEYREDSACFCLKEIINQAWLAASHEYFEIIGNIYENPELLEQ